MHRMFSVGRERGSAHRETVGEGRSAAPLDIRLRVLGDRSVREKVCVAERVCDGGFVDRGGCGARVCGEPTQC